MCKKYENFTKKHEKQIKLNVHYNSQTLETLLVRNMSAKTADQHFHFQYMNISQENLNHKWNITKRNMSLGEQPTPFDFAVVQKGKY